MKKKSKIVIAIIVVMVVLAIISGIAFSAYRSSEEYRKKKASETYEIAITIPSGNRDKIIYSQEEISPKGEKLKIEVRSELKDPDMELKLNPTWFKGKSDYKPIKIARGIPVELDVEKGAWFLIGVKAQNDTDSDIVVYVEIEEKEAELRISASVVEAEERNDNSDNPIENQDYEVNESIEETENCYDDPNNPVENHDYKVGEPQND